MTDACRDLKSSLARGPHEPLAATARTHLAACDACRDHAATVERLVGALRAEPEPVDDITRVRWLARLAPSLDALTDRAARPSARRSERPRRALWLAGAAAAIAAASVAWWVQRSGAPDRAPAAIAAVDSELLRPYVASGTHTDGAALALLAGRFAVLDVGAGQLVRASFDRDRDQRVAVVGPAHVAVVSATTAEVELDASGTLLVDARSPTIVRVRAGGLSIRAQRATFAVQTGSGGTVVFVDRGELDVTSDRSHLARGDWYGPSAGRTAALVQMLRDHANAIAPPSGRSGILAVEGTSPVLTQRGAVIGTAPLRARLDAAELVVVIAGEPERRETVSIGETLARVIEPPPEHERPEIAAGRSRGWPRREPRDRKTAQIRPDTSHADAEHDAARRLYARAEAELRRGEHAAAERSWRELLDTQPRSPHAASALYDLANLVRGTDRAAAQRYLDRLLAGPPPAALREPASYLACRLHVDGNQLDAAAACFAAFRASFPASSHDAEVLAWLAGYAHATGGCAAARTLAVEYVRKYPHGPFAARAAACSEAPR